jgi:hypothetical protein
MRVNYLVPDSLFPFPHLSPHRFSSRRAPGFLSPMVSSAPGPGKCHVHIRAFGFGFAGIPGNSVSEKTSSRQS